MINSKNDNITQKNTYGWHRVEVVGAMSALVFLASLSFGTAIEALQVINSLWKWDFFIVGTAIYYNVSKKMILLLWAWPTFVASKFHINTQYTVLKCHIPPFKWIFEWSELPINDRWKYLSWQHWFLNNDIFYVSFPLL